MKERERALAQMIQTVGRFYSIDESMDPIDYNERREKKTTSIEEFGACHTRQRLIAKLLSNLLLLLYCLTEAVLVSQHSIIIIRKYFHFVKIVSSCVKKNRSKFSIHNKTLTEHCPIPITIRIDRKQLSISIN